MWLNRAVMHRTQDLQRHGKQFTHNQAYPDAAGQGQQHGHAHRHATPTTRLELKIQGHEQQRRYTVEVAVVVGRDELEERSTGDVLRVLELAVIRRVHRDVRQLNEVTCQGPEEEQKDSPGCREEDTASKPAGKRITSQRGEERREDQQAHTRQRG